MTTDDDPQARVALLPTFKQPPTPPPTDQPTPPAITPEMEAEADRRVARMMWHGSPPRPGRPGAGSAGGPGPERTPTETSSDGDLHKPTPAEAAALMVGVLGILVAGAAFVVRWRTSRKLRQPTKQQTYDIAAPLGRILLRHADLTWLGPDIADGIKASAATGAYLNDGPLLLGPDVDAGIPAGLQDLED